jgi:hypothetical protein
MILGPGGVTREVAAIYGRNTSTASASIALDKSRMLLLG